jgi:hypothetical protein
VNPETDPAFAPRELALTRHPASPGAPACRITVAVLRPSVRRLRLRYCLAADLEALALPPAGPPRRGHELWKHLCFEAFVMAGGGPAYHELNFSPSGEWAIYRLDGYRTGFAPATDIAAPQLAIERQPGRLVLDATADPAALPAAGLRLALSAVIEDAGGRLSYWALAHPAAAPDFHHPDGFVLRLPVRQDTRTDLQT